MMGATIFASITAAVIISTLIIMSLMRGEIASALSSNVQNSAPITTQAAGTCSVPAEDLSAAAASTTAASDDSGVMVAQHSSMAAPLMHWPMSVNNSYNNTSTVTNTTTNNITNTEIDMSKKLVIKDSFNDNSTHVKVVDSFNPIVVKDNTVNLHSNNNTAVNSGNTTTSNVTTNMTTNTTTNTTTNVNSNNSVETHVLSDNVVVVTPPAEAEQAPAAL